MRKRFFKLISGVLSFTMLALSVDFSVLAAEPVICEEVTDDTVSEDAEIIPEEIDESEVTSEECTDDNRNDFDNEAASEEASEETEEESVIVEETAEDGVPSDDKIAGEDAVIEEIPEEEIPNDVVADDELNGKTAAKEKTRAELYEAARKKDGVTITKTADEISSPYAHPQRTVDGPKRYVYDLIYFGAYLQTDTDKDGKFNDEMKEPIKWNVLSVDEDNRALLWSEKVLDQYIYTDTNGLAEMRWDYSQLRSWLNGYSEDMNVDNVDFSSGNSFVDIAFTADEKERLLEQNLTDNFYDFEVGSYDFPQYDTTDKVFLPSEKDMLQDEYKYYGYFCKTGELTDYASQPYFNINGTKYENPVVFYDSEDDYGKWLDFREFFLRTIDYGRQKYLSEDGEECRYEDYSYCAATVKYSGYDDLRMVDWPAKPKKYSEFHLGGIRPVICIDLDETEWAYAGQKASDGMPYREVDVHFDANGGKIECENAKYSIFSLEYNVEGFPSPSKEGYKPCGWKRFDPDGKQHTNTPINESFVMEDGVWFEAEWELISSKSKTIYFHPNIEGYSAKIRYINFKEGQLIDLPSIKDYYPDYSELQPYFLGWYTEPVGGRLIRRTEMAMNVPQYIYAHWDKSEVDIRDIENLKYDEFWTSDVNAVEYTGGKVKPKIRVYFGLKRLDEGTHYSIKYTNNQNVCGKDETNAPTIAIKGKGNYSSTETVKFDIVPKRISDEKYNALDGVTISSVSVKANGNEQKPLPKVKADGKKLINGRDYTFRYLIGNVSSDADGGEETPVEYNEIDSVKEKGKYVLEISGCGNYCGTVRTDFSVSDGTDLTSLKVSKIKDVVFNFDEGHEVKPEIKITDGKYILAEGLDYVCSYRANTKVGTASVVITGTDNPANERQYFGNMTVSFNILPLNLKGAEVSGIPDSVTYTGCEQKAEEIKVVKDGIELVNGEDYEVSYVKNVNSGKATVFIEGKNTCTGCIKKFFKIMPLDFQNGLEGENPILSIDVPSKVVYTTGSTVPEITIKYFFPDNKEILLLQGRDYTLKCSNNKKVNDGTSAKVPTVKIIGKGNFTGVITKNFTISRSDIENCQMGTPNKAYQNKPGKWKSKIVLLDANGKKLKAGRDYVNSNKYVYERVTVVKNGNKEVRRFAGETINKNDILPAGTTIRVVLKGKGNYDGEKYAKYSIVKKQLSKLKIKVADFEYTGKEIVPMPYHVSVKDGDERIGTDQYNIVSHRNNINVGTAELTLQGCNNYVGTVKVKYKITPKKIKWWWNKGNE